MLRAGFQVHCWECWLGCAIVRNDRKPIWIFSCWKKDLIGKCISVDPTEKQCFPSQWGTFRYKQCLCLVNPVLTCNCLDYLYPPSIDLRLCNCLFLHFNMSCVSSLPIPQNSLAQELLYFSPALESTAEAWTYSFKHFVNATGRRNHLISTKSRDSPSQSVSFALFFKTNFDFTVNAF